MKVYTVRGDPVGLPPEGSEAWIRVTIKSLLSHAGQSQYDAERAAESGRWLRDHPEAWYDPDNPLRRFGTWAEFTKAMAEVESGWVDFLIDHEEIVKTEGLSYQQARQAHAEHLARVAQPLAGHGTNQHSESGVGDTNSTPTANTAEYLARRLARDRPDLIERMKEGEFPSVRAAALEAGIVKQRVSFIAGDVESWRRATLKAFPGSSPTLG